MTTRGKLPTPKTLERPCGPVAPTSGVEAAADEYVREIRESMKSEFEGFLPPVDR